MTNKLLTNITRFSENQIAVNTGMANKKTSTTILYAVCAGRVIQDNATGKYSYVDIFDRIQLPQGDNPLYQTFFVAGKLANIQAGKHTIGVEIHDPENKVIGNVSFGERDLLAGEAPFSAFFFIVKIEKTGKHLVRVTLDGKTLTDNDRFYFDVTRAGGQ